MTYADITRIQRLGFDFRWEVCATAAVQGVKESERGNETLRRGEVVLRASPVTTSFDATSEARKCETDVTSSSFHPSSSLFSSLPFHLTPIPLREELLLATMNLRAQLHQHKEREIRNFFDEVFLRKLERITLAHHTLELNHDVLRFLAIPA
jgi:hypothetical protein